MAGEAIVATTDNEIEAEIIASRLRAEGIPVRVRYESQAGIPRQIAPAGFGFGLGAFRIAVPAAQADAARALLSDVVPAAPRRHPLFRAVAVLVLVSFVLAWIPGLLNLLHAVIGGR
ncbi:MAG: hypothetical protein NVS1B1_05490 [Candidatus Limnocylindrales bacterium]